MTPATDALPAIAGRRSARVVARSLFALTKPRIIELLLVTTIPTMLLAQRGLPPIRVLLVTLVAGACAAGSANTINCYIDRDIDAIMRRTSRRPLNGKGREAAVIKPPRRWCSASCSAPCPPSCSARWSTGCPRRWPTPRSCSTCSSTRSA